jgi:hypothetical protein
MSRRVFILEPSLVDERGHHAFATSRFATLIGNRRCVIAANARWAGALTLDGTPVQPLFEHDRSSVARLRRYGRNFSRVLSFADRSAAPLTAMIRAKRLAHTDTAEITAAAADARQMPSVTATDLQRVLTALGVAVRADGEGDLVFIPSADAESMLAVAELLATGRNMPQFHLRLMYDDIGSHVTDPTWRSALAVLAAARGAVNARIQLLAETRAFARVIETLWPDPVAVLPHPSVFEPCRPNVPPASEFTLYIPGQIRADKGRHLLSVLLRTLSDNHAKPPIRLLVHTEGINGDNIKSHRSVTVVCLPSHATEADYSASWHQSHAALLLHDPRVYALRGSGVVCDAVASGRPFIHLAGASLSEWGSFGNALRAEATASSIMDAVGQMIRDYERYETGSAAVAAAFPQTLQDGLRGLADF